MEQPATPQTLIGRCIVAGLLAGLVEVALFVRTGFEPGLGLVLVHLVGLACVGGLSGVGALLLASERVAARFWLVGPSILALVPLLDRRLGWIGLVAVVAVAGWWMASGRRGGRTSVLASGLAGALVASHLGVFLVRDYDGRNTDLSPLLTLVTAGAVSLLIHLVVPRLRRDPLAGTPSRVLMGGGLVTLATVTLVLANGLLPSVTAPVGATMEGTSRPVVIVVLDTVRADHLELYGYQRETMPALTRFAETDGVVVERAITNAPDSLSAHASLFTGLFPSQHGAHRPVLVDPEPPRFGYPLRVDLPTLAEVLAEHGYATVGVSGNSGPVSREVGLGIDRGFDIYRSVPDGSCTFSRWSPWSRLGMPGGDGPVWLPACLVRYRRAEVITDEAIHFVDEMEHGNFLLFVNYMDAHLPYSPPEEYRRTFLGPEAAAETVGLPVSTEVQLSDEIRDRIRALYDAELRYLDTELARLLERLRGHPAWDDMLVVITSDHGEALGEHGLIGHTSSLYDVMIRVPLVLRVGRDGVVGVPPPGSRWRRPMQLVDVLPLVQRHTGVEMPVGDGRSPDGMPGALRAWSFPSQAQIKADGRFRRELRSIEDDGWKLIEDDVGRVELYDLRVDPEEQRNVAASHAERVEQMRAGLGSRAVYRTESLADDPGLSQDALERLRSLGYIR